MDPWRCLPSIDQELLLKAALLPVDAALQAWQAWRARNDLNDIDGGSRRLLPLVHCNLSRRGGHGSGHEPDLGHLRRIHRNSWHRNQLLIVAAQPVLAAMQATGLAPVLLKGSALSITVYGDTGARPMADIDVLVRPHEALEAGRTLVAHGFGPQFRLDEQRVRTLNAVNFVSSTSGAASTNGGTPLPRNGGGAVAGALDLHWHLLPEPCDEAFDDAVHARARPAMLRDLPVRVLDPTDELLLACAHGIRWNPMPPFRWAADAHLLVTRAGESIDWPRLVDAARRSGLTMPLLAALQYVATALGTPVPAAVLADLEAVRPTASERAEFLLRVSPLAEGLFGNLPAYVLRWMRLTRGASAAARLRGFPAFLGDCWGLKDASEVPRHALSLVRTRLGKLLGMGQ